MTSIHPEAEALLASIRNEMSYAVRNDHRLAPAADGKKGSPVVLLSYLEAAIEGWRKAVETTAVASVAVGGSLHVEARECDKCGHVGINDSLVAQSACTQCDWSGVSPEEDRCPGCGVEGAMTAACPTCHSRYRLVAEDDLEPHEDSANPSSQVSVADLNAACDHLADVHNVTQMQSACGQLRPEVVATLASLGLVPEVYANSPASVEAEKPAYERDLADQAARIDVERLAYWLVRYGIAVPVSREVLGTRVGEFVNQLVRRDPFPNAAPEVSQDANLGVGMHRGLRGLILKAWACSKPHDEVTMEMMRELLAQCVPYLRTLAFPSGAPEASRSSAVVLTDDQSNEIIKAVTSRLGGWSGSSKKGEYEGTLSEIRDAIRRIAQPGVAT